ncbi:MAG: hypothetical protein NQ127_02020 [Candidatus Cardinium sp.]|nr:hypothetical protein [Candidatus Cardinium sp.]
MLSKRGKEKHNTEWMPSFKEKTLARNAVLREKGGCCSGRNGVTKREALILLFLVSLLKKLKIVR